MRRRWLLWRFNQARKSMFAARRAILRLDFLRIDIEGDCRHYQLKADRIKREIERL
jgi:hypothetical protein